MQTKIAAYKVRLHLQSSLQTKQINCSNSWCSSGSSSDMCSWQLAGPVVHTLLPCYPPTAAAVHHVPERLGKLLIMRKGGGGGGATAGTYECSTYREARFQECSLIEQLGQCAVGCIVRIRLKLVLDLLYEGMAWVDLQNTLALHVGLPLGIPQSLQGVKGVSSSGVQDGSQTAKMSCASA